MASTADIINQLNQARDLAFTSKESFPQVVRHIFNFVNNPDLEIQKWTSQFLKDSFTADESKLAIADKVDLAIDSLDSVLTLTNIKNLEVFQTSVDISVVVFRLIFRYVADNDGCHDIWQKLTQLKTSLITKFTSNFPYEESFNTEINQMKNLHSKLELIKFLILVVDYQSKSAPNVKSFSLARVNPNHSLIKASLEAEAHALIDLLLKPFTSEILVTPLLTATWNHLVVICKRKPQFISKICITVDQFESNNKLQSNYQSLENYKLSKKFVDRTLRVFINHLLRNQLVPTQYQSALNKKLTQLISRGDEIRKKNILVPNPELDKLVQKRHFEGFVNATKKLKSQPDYKSLYCLNEPANELNNFDLSTLPQNILISMTLAALNKVNSKKLTSALDIISARYVDAVSHLPVASALAPQQGGQITQQQQQKAPAGQLPDAYEVDRLTAPDPRTMAGDDDEEDDDAYDTVGQDYNPQTVYSLPPPKALTVQQKKDHISIIIQNFFKLADRDVSEVDNSAATDLLLDNPENNGASKELTKIAIESWKKDSWLILLTRLATRGMRTDSAYDTKDENNSEPQSTNKSNSEEELGDMIRTAIFDYFLGNIHSRIDLIIEWLNEEWYSEKVFNEDEHRERIRAKIYAEYEETEDKSDYDLQLKLNAELDKVSVDTPRYNKWAGKVLDAMIPFLEPNDRKIFIRLLSDLPFLNDDLVGRIKSLCYDPVRIKIGFLSLQFLIMYRPPVKQACLTILRQLADGDQEDLKEESEKLLAKYS